MTRFATLIFTWSNASRGNRIATFTRCALLSPRRNRSHSGAHACTGEARAYSMVLLDAYSPLRRGMFTGHRRERLARPAYGGARQFVAMTLSVTWCVLRKIVYKASVAVAIAHASW